MERNFYQRFFLSYQKRFSPTGAFIIMQLFANDFRVRPKVWKNNITRNSSRSVILTLLTLLSAVQNQLYFWGFRHYPKLEYATTLDNDNFHWQLSLSQRCVKRSVICKCQCFCFCLFDIQQLWILSYALFSPSQKFPFEEIQLCVNCYASFLRFHSTKY